VMMMMMMMMMKCRNDADRALRCNTCVGSDLL